MSVTVINNIDISKVMAEWDERVKKALTDAAKIVEEDAKAKAPGHGKLAASIKQNVNGNVATIGSNLYYAKFVEKGTGIFAIGGGSEVKWRYKSADGTWHTTPGQSPKPFLEPALFNNKAKIFQCFVGVF